MSFGEHVQRLRKRRKLSQAQLAKLMGSSQPTVSRLETAENPPEDARLLSKLAQGLDVSLTELLSDFPLPHAFTAGDLSHFYAFCPNPLCESNSAGRSNNGQLVVTWKSGTNYDANEFDSINFCNRCGEDLVKECPSCKKPLRGAGTRYCSTCGTKVCDRPTEDEWRRLREMYTASETPVDDLPF